MTQALTSHKRSPFKRSVSLLGTTALLAASLMGCASTASGTTTAADTAATASDSQSGTTASIDLSKSVQLQFYMLGDAPQDMDAVSEQINALTQQDLNCTVKFNFTTWTDWQEKYNTILASGEPVDLMYTAPWASYGVYAKKGAFLALNDLLPTYAPELYAHVSESDWEQCKTDGNIYTIPSTYKEYFSSGLIYREDLRQAYNLPVPDTFENIQAYMQGIKDNLPSQMVTNDQGSYYLAFKEAAQLTDYGLAYDYYNPSEVSTYWGSDQFIEDMQDIKSWADSGYWSKSILSDKTDTMNDFYSGKIVITSSGINPQKYITAKMTIEQNHPDWEVGYVMGPEGIDYAAYTNHPLNNGYAIPVSSENPERALMFYEKMVMDQTYNQLTEYGIEGTDYTVEDGIYQQVGDGFGYEGMNGWSWRNPDYMLKTESTDQLNEIFDQLDQVIQTHPEKYSAKITDGFFEDTTDYENELAAVNNVVSQYLNPLLYGEVDDVEAATQTFMEKAEEAGLSKVQEGWTTQWKAYCQENDY